MADEEFEPVFRSAADQDEDEEEKPFYKVHWFGLTNLVLVLIWTAIGVAVSMWFADWRFVTAVYVMVQILTTIGYGDVSITTANGPIWLLQLFYTVWVFLAFGIVANIVNTYSSKLLEANEEMFKSKLRSYEKSLACDSDASTVDDETLSNKFGLRNKFIASFGGFIFFFLIGALFYRYMEHCSCGYGKGKIDGCEEGDRCTETGGQTKNWTQSLYMSMITLTTVGFGDFTPKSELGRWFGLFWMVFGVLSAANFVGSLSDVIEYYKEKGKKKKREKFSREVFDKIDKDKNNCLSRSEFYAWFLVNEGYITEDVVQRLDKIFNSMDTNESDKLEYHTLVEKFGAE